IIGNEPFAVLLPDVLVLAKQKGCLAQMLEVQAELGDKSNLIAVEEIPADQTHQYGVVGMGAKKGRAFEITQMVEKPAKGTAPSNNIVTGRYILQPEIFGVLEKGERGAGGEIQLTDAMITLSKSQKFYGYNFDGTTYDCGSKLGFIAANLAFGLARGDLAPALRGEIARITAKS
ncbi:MAG TPA: sugar phosphate nucleotidyltransferase, partial [Xanthobacteraceae bacterium]|nr:sugar phosphate nucleotidyltransferase [Xanthobacteraceae bacterium]